MEDVAHKTGTSSVGQKSPQPQKSRETKIVPKAKTFPTWGDILVFLGIFVVAATIANLLLVFFSDTLPREELTAIGYMLQFGLTIAGILFYRWKRGGKGKLLRFSIKWFNAALVIWGLVLMIAVSIVIEPLQNLFPDKYLDLLDETIGTGGWAVLTAVVLAPVLEETLFRGIILESIRQKSGAFVAILLSAAIFGVIHLIPQQVIYAFFMGIVLGFVYIQTESLFSVMLIHAVNNGIAMLTMHVTGSSGFSIREAIPNPTVYHVVYAVCALLVVAGFVSIVLIVRRQEAKEQSLAKETDPASQQPSPKADTPSDRQ